MIKKILEVCPNCGGELEIGEVHCTNCETQIHARYRPCYFCMLTEEQSTFLRLFVLSRGNLTEVEKRLGVSYPTVRAKLDEVTERLNASESAVARSPLSPPPRRRGNTVRISDRDPMVDSAGEPDSRQAQSSIQVERRRVLADIARGEISAEDGMNMIRALGASHADESRGTEDRST
jgi:hypothetical protein